MSHTGPKDNIYETPKAMIVDFAFDKAVAHVFPDMIRRSVPGYDNLIPLLGIIAEKYVKDNTNIYDLGCSLGAATISIGRRLKTQGCKITAIDNAPAMVEQCRKNIAIESSNTPVEVVCDDINNTTITNASLIIMNFTLQFIEPPKRLSLLENIAAGMNDGGALILSEKIISNETKEQSQLEDLHLRFKSANGYSDLEISQKRSALDNVLIPDTLDTHQQRLKAAGFKQVFVWQQSFNFLSMLAIK